MQHKMSGLMSDAVDKVGDEQRAGNNRIQVPSFLNRFARQTPILTQCCSLAPRKTFIDASSQRDIEGTPKREGKGLQLVCNKPPLWWMTYAPAGSLRSAPRRTSGDLTADRVQPLDITMVQAMAIVKHIGVGTARKASRRTPSTASTGSKSEMSFGNFTVSFIAWRKTIRIRTTGRRNNSPPVIVALKNSLSHLKPPPADRPKSLIPLDALLPPERVL